MQALIVYESMYGNTRGIAAAVARGVSTRLAVDTVDVAGAPDRLPAGVRLLVVGAPTHAFGLSRASTRTSAAEQGELVHRGDEGVREWLDRLRLDGPVDAATFDTRVSRPRVPGSAAARAHRILRRHGANLLARPETFWVEGVTGPTVGGESERARDWGAALAGDAARQTGVRPRARS